MSGIDAFVPASEDLFFRSPKTGDPRFGEIAKIYSDNQFPTQSYLIAGYPDDEGIGLNLGRQGAALGPEAIRRRFYKTSQSHFHPSDLPLFDLGNLKPHSDIASRHEALKQNVCAALKASNKWIGLGGGHDYGYPDGAGFLMANKDSKKKPIIINFDAHLDVRPTDKGLSSGTPFYRLLTDPDLPEFDFYEVGIQTQCNSQEHIRWAKQKGAHILFHEDIMMSGQNPMTYLSQYFAELMVSRRPTYISVDIDCFSTAYAMGCSQAWPTGFSPNDLLPILSILYHRLDVQVLGIYEVSPPLDLDERTVKLAAQILHQFLGPLG